MSYVSLEEKKKLTNKDYALAGAVSGAVTRGLCQPLDVLKIRFQLQVEPLRKEAGVKYWGISQALRQIVKDEGIFALWKGHMPAQLLSIIYGIAQFGSFEFLSRLAPVKLQSSPYIHFFSGSAAGCFATVVSFPCDVVRTRLVAQGEPKIYNGFSHAVVQIFTKEGTKGFFKGLSPTIIQVAPHTGAQFAFYSGFKMVWKNIVGDETRNYSSNSVLLPVSFSGSLVCGSVAGLCAKTVVYPFDLARKRLQIQGFEEARLKFGKAFTCNGLFNCFWKTIREEKIVGLFKGLSPSLLKAGVTSALHFAVYEETCHFLEFVNSRR